MRFSIAHIASAVVVAALAVTTTACGSNSSQGGSGLVYYESGSLGFLLSYSAPSGGGPITGTITIAQQCLGAERLRTPVQGRAHPRGRHLQPAGPKSGQ